MDKYTKMLGADLKADKKKFNTDGQKKMASKITGEGRKQALRKNTL